jgi:hypothetical protein
MAAVLAALTGLFIATNFQKTAAFIYDTDYPL